MISLILGLHLLQQHSRSPDELKDTHISRFACMLHAHTTVHVIFEEIHLCQYGCLSSRLDFRNAALGDEDTNVSIVY